MKRRLITSALPYVNNIPHLGNLIQVLSADVFARYCRLRGFETLYVCGTDEYGTATETRALEEGVSPKELCDRYFALHDVIYRWFDIAFDRFGRTSTPNHTKITQDIFLKLDAAGYISEKTIQQLYCENDRMFLADRYVRGTCPHCGYGEARGDQCEDCGKLLDPTDLVEPRCGTCGNTPVLRSTRHLYIDLPAVLPKLRKWLDRATAEGFWARNAVRMTEAWIRDGLIERCITRDLKWGIPVPKDGYREKVFYVWFDAPIGYISITSNHTDDWESWWKKPEEVRLYQFVGKDNIPFHTVIFPCSLLGSGDDWTLLHHISSSEYLNYETGKFSKSKGVGVFGEDARETGIPPDVWRFYIFYNRPEKSDAQFVWRDFQEKVNSELIGNLGNLVNRTLTFVHRYFDGELPADHRGDQAFWRRVREAEEAITESLEKVELRDALRRILALSSVGNKRFQDEEPWRRVKEHPSAAAGLLGDLVYLIRDLAVLIGPFLPQTAARVASFLGVEDLEWKDLGVLSGVRRIQRPELLFVRLEDGRIEELRTRYAGAEGRVGSGQPAAGSPPVDRTEREEETEVDMTSDQELIAGFRSLVDIRVARIETVERHPRADKLYIETVTLGDETRQIVSGLVPYYAEADLQGKNILLVTNLKAAKLRGAESQGMLLAAEKGDTVEVIFAGHAQPGDRVVVGGQEPAGKAEDAGGGAEGSAGRPKEISIEQFFSIPITVRDYTLYVADRPLLVKGKAITVEKVKDGKVG